MQQDGTLPANVREELLFWCKASRQHQNHDLVHLARLAEVCKRFLKDSAVSHIASCSLDPILVTYAGDGTPISTRHNICIHSSGESVRRSGRGTSEFYVHHAIVASIDAMGVRRSSVVLEDPRPMTAGKKSPNEIALLLGLVPDARAAGHQGILVLHYAWDRAKFEANSRHIRQYHTMQLLHPNDHDINSERMLAFLRTWVITTPCSLHDCHNSLRWAMHQLFDDLEIAKSVYIVLESCLNSYQQFIGYLPRWLGEHLRLVAEDRLPAPHELQELWTALGCDPFIVSEIVDLRLCLVEGHLNVRSGAAAGAGIAHRVTFDLLSVWRFTKHSEGRWCSVGTSSRTLVAGLLCGLESLVHAILKDESESKYYISGFNRLEGDVRKFVATVALASFPADECLRVLLRDSRLCKMLDMIEHTLKDECLWLSELSDFTWAALSSVCGSSAGELQADVLQCAHVSIGFMKFRFLWRVNGLPFRLCLGDVSANVDGLFNGDKPEEPIAAKIWTLMHAFGESKAAIVRGLVLMREAHWHTAIAEQQHASGSIVAKFHKEITTDALMIRAALHTFRHLLPELSPVQRQELKLRSRLERLEKKHPRKCGAKQMLCKQLVAISSRWKQDRSREVEAQVQKRVFRKHGAIWQRVPEPMKQSFGRLAALHASGGMHKLREDIGDTLQELTQLQMRLEQERYEDRPISLQACKLSDSQLMQLDAYREHGGFTPERVANLRREALEAPRALSQSMLQTMSSIRVWKPDEVARPPWVSQVAAQRDHFRSTIFIVEHAGRALHLKFLFATQSPVYIGFGVMKEEHHHVVMQEVGSSNWDELSRDYWPLRFRFDFLEHVAWSEIADVPIESIGVLPFVSYHGCNLCVSCSEVVTLASFLESLPSLPARASASSTSQAQRGMPRDHASDLVIKYPWLAGSLERDVAAARTTASSSGGAGEVVEEMSCEALTDEQIEQAFTALRAEKEKYAGDDDEEVVDWQVSVLGGAWTLRHRGVAFNAFRSAPRVGSVAEQWAADYNMGKSARFDMSLYGSSVANDLAKGYSHRCQYFFDIWLCSGNERYTYSQHDLDAYVEPCIVSELQDILQGRALARLRWLQSLVPRCTT